MSGARHNYLYLDLGLLLVLLAACSAPAAAPFVTPLPTPLEVTEPAILNDVIPTLTFEEYPIVSADEDHPFHFEYYDRLTPRDPRCAPFLAQVSTCAALFS